MAEIRSSSMWDGKLAGVLAGNSGRIQKGGSHGAHYFPHRRQFSIFNFSWTAVEQLKNGSKVDLREIPAIIGGDQSSRHGIVLAKSSLAKSYGIQTGEPVVNAFRKCPNLDSTAES